LLTIKINKGIKMLKIIRNLVLFFCASFLLLSCGQGGSGKKSETLEKTKKAGFLNCGVSQGLAGFSNADEAGNWTGIDVDVCRAVAAAVLGDSQKVKFFPLSAKERFESLKSKQIDVLSRNTTWTLTRDAELGLTFVGVNFYDGQGFMVTKASGMRSTDDFVSGMSVCTNIGTTTELNLADFMARKKIDYKLVGFEKADEARDTYGAGRCDAYTTDKSGLAAQRTALPSPDDHVVLPETISKEPLGPVVRQGDAIWEDIVRWSLNVMIEAEEYGVTSKNADSLKSSDNPAHKKILGVEDDMGLKLGLDNDWGYRIITQVGNYGEVYKRHLQDSGILPGGRGDNELWTNGGVLYVPPLR
jgi:general L-amino acid transport system substrate-binding protein